MFLDDRSLTGGRGHGECGRRVSLRICVLLYSIPDFISRPCHGHTVDLLLGMTLTDTDIALLVPVDAGESLLDVVIGPGIGHPLIVLEDGFRSLTEIGGLDRTWPWRCKLLSALIRL